MKKVLMTLSFLALANLAMALDLTQIRKCSDDSIAIRIEMIGQFKLSEETTGRLEISESGVTSVPDLVFVHRDANRSNVVTLDEAHLKELDACYSESLKSEANHSILNIKIKIQDHSKVGFFRQIHSMKFKYNRADQRMQYKYSGYQAGLLLYIFPFAAGSFDNYQIMIKE